MAIIGQFENGALLVRETVAGPASYSTAAPPAITFSDLSQVDAVLSLVADNGHLVNVDAIVGQVVDFRMRGLDAAGATDGDVLLEIPDAQDESGTDITGIAVGR